MGAKLQSNCALALSGTSLEAQGWAPVPKLEQRGLRSLGLPAGGWRGESEGHTHVPCPNKVHVSLSLEFSVTKPALPLKDSARLLCIQDLLGSRIRRSLVGLFYLTLVAFPGVGRSLGKG